MRASWLLVVVLVAACRGSARPATAPSPLSDRAALTRVITAQLARAASDWNRGDLDGFLSDYASEGTTTIVDGYRARSGIGFITASGPFTLVMEHRSEGWRILHDHSSSDPR